MAANTIFLGKGETSVPQQVMYLPMMNRHGLVTGATGTGKTVSLQVMAEQLSRAGVCVFAADVKGDLSGMSVKGEPKDFLEKRAADVGLKPYTHDSTPVIFWDLFGQQGHPIRTTITEMGPLLLSRLMGLSDAQEGALNIAFKLADQEGMLLLDLKDLRSYLQDLASRGKEITTQYGNVQPLTIGAIQRQLVVLEEQGGDKFFGEPALDMNDFLHTTRDGKGYVNILAADRLMTSPQLYATFLLWLMSELFEKLPEMGDPEKPKLVFFFDEAHLLFTDTPPGLLQKIEQTVKLIRSKGVGIYFVTQNPLDVPDSVLAQLGNRVQHALRAYTPRDQKAVNAAAETFRPNPKFNTAQAITQLGIGEALVSVLDLKGVPTMVEKTLMAPPVGQIGPITAQQRAILTAASPVMGKYDKTFDRDSAYEALQHKAANATGAAPAAKPAGRAAPQRETATDRFIKNAAGSIGRSLGSALVRGVLGSLGR